jgi:hypothetical protein
VHWNPRHTVVALNALDERAGQKMPSSHLMQNLRVCGKLILLSCGRNAEKPFRRHAACEALRVCHSTLCDQFGFFETRLRETQCSNWIKGVSKSSCRNLSVTEEASSDTTSSSVKKIGSALC